MFGHRNELLKINHPISVLVKFSQRFLDFSVAWIETNGPNQASKFVLIDFIVAVFVKNVERGPHDTELFICQLRYFNGHLELVQLETRLRG